MLRRMEDTLQRLLDAAGPLVGEKTLSRPDYSAGSVAAALLTRGGNIYTGICLELSCGIGFCAEHAAVAEMLKAGETSIEMVVAVGKSGILSPCGRCRELFVQVDVQNFDTVVALPDGRSLPLRDLLPLHWKHTNQGEQRDDV
jgi:cytidine deaminase